MFLKNKIEFDSLFYSRFNSLMSLLVRAEVELHQRHVGESVVLRCSGPPGGDQAYGVRLKRCWLQRDQVLFMHKDSNPYVSNPLDAERVAVSGDPGALQVNVTLSDLTPGDTDRYCCEFVVDATPEDKIIRGQVEFFIYVANGELSSIYFHFCCW